MRSVSPGQQQLLFKLDQLRTTLFSDVPNADCIQAMTRLLDPRDEPQDGYDASSVQSRAAEVLRPRAFELWQAVFFADDNKRVNLAKYDIGSIFCAIVHPANVVSVIANSTGLYVVFHQRGQLATAWTLFAPAGDYDKLLRASVDGCSLIGPSIRNTVRSTFGQRLRRAWSALLN